MSEDRFTGRGKIFVAVDAPSPRKCDGCFFSDPDIDCTKLPPCSPVTRADGRDVIFAEKVGEPRGE